MQEGMSAVESPPRADPSMDKTAASAARGSPRCEAFLMTGDKMLALHPRISSSLIKLAENQLSPAVKNAATAAAAAAASAAATGSASAQESSPPRPPPPLHARTPTNGTASATAAAPPPSPPARATPPLPRRQSSSTSPVVPASQRGSITPSHDSMELALRGVQVQTRPTRSPLASSPLASSLHASSPVASKRPSLPFPTAADGVDRADEGETPPPPLSPRLAHLSSNGGGGGVQSHGSGVAFHTVAGTSSSLFSRRAELDADVARQYVAMFNWSGVALDLALREFLARVELRGETSEREKLLVFFSRRWSECNPTAIAQGYNAVHALVCALLLLNSDLHSEASSRKMTSREFVVNLSHTGFVYCPQLLKRLYKSIKHQPIHFYGCEPDSTTLGGGKSLAEASRSSSVAFSSRLSQHSQIADPDTQVEYKRGWLVRKRLFDSEQARTPFGQRGWQMKYARLAGTALYLSNSEEDSSSSLYAKLASSILLAHAIADTNTGSLTKRPNVFRLRTAQLGECLLQTSGENEVAEWVNAINFVCAAFSSPALPAPVCSSGEFFRPVLPRQPSTLPLPDQLRHHISTIHELRDKLTLCEKDAPSLHAKSRLVHKYFLKQRFLQQELSRYRTYVSTLIAAVPWLAEQEGVGAAMLLDCGGGAIGAPPPRPPRRLVGDSSSAISTLNEHDDEAALGYGLTSPLGASVGTVPTTTAAFC